MSPLIFGYVEARRIAIEVALQGRHLVEAPVSIRERLGRTLIHWGEQLATAPPERVARPAA
ncbi:MAG: hypothetical protein WD651_03265 [Acidimicrobiia bacterium]